MSITFNDLLTDPKYRDMDFESFYKLWHSDEISLQTANESCSKLGFSQGLKSRGCWEHLQKLKAESEKKAEDIKVIDRYPMCKDQPAQIDCVRKDCIYNEEGGKCTNISPAISLNDKSTFVCWSEKRKTIDDIVLGEIKKSKQGSDCINDAFNVTNGFPNLTPTENKESAPASSETHMIFNRKSLPDEIDMSKYIKQAPIQITDQKAREIAAKYFNCPPNELKILHP